MAQVISIEAELAEAGADESTRIDHRAARLGFTCTRCKASPGEPCRTPKGRARLPHAPRLDRYLRALHREQADL